MKRTATIIALVALALGSACPTAAEPWEHRPHHGHQGWHPNPGVIVSYPVAVPVPQPVFVPVAPSIPVYTSPYATQCVVPGVGWVWMAQGVFVPRGGACTMVDGYGRPWAGVAQ